MEILSDATFKWNVSVEGKTGIKELNLVYPDGRSYSYITGSEFSLIEDSIHGDICGLRVSKVLEAKTICACNMTVKFLNLTDSTSQLSSNGLSFSLPTNSGKIALTSDIAGIPIPKCVKQTTVSLAAPSDCTFFKVEMSQTPDIVINRFIEKFYNAGSGCKLIEPCFWENTDIDIFQSSNYSRSTFFIRKAVGMEFLDDKTFPNEFYRLVVTYV